MRLAGICSGMGFSGRNTRRRWFLRGTGLLAPALLLMAASLTSCNRGGMVGQNRSPNGSSSDQDSKRQSPATSGQKGQAQPQFTEPQASVDGQPSAASDRGGPDAVSHRSVAQPGAPQGTVTPDPSLPAGSAHPAHR